MKIYIIPAWYPQDDCDLNGIFVREQAHALAERGHDVTVIHIETISFTQIGKKIWHEKREWQDGNVRTFFHKVIIPIPGKFAALQDKYISNLFTKIVASHIKDDNTAPDILHAHVSHSCAYYCLKASEKLRIPLIVTEHYSGLLLGTATDREYERVKQTIEKANAFIFVGTNFQKKLCEKLNISNKTYIVPNMIDVEAYKIKDKSNDKFVFLTACSLKKNKSVDLVVKAFHKAFDRKEQVKLVIAGDGEQLDDLKEISRQLNEENRIEFLGRYSREDAGKIFSSADTFALTSEIETFGIVYIEALACGLPCIGTKGQGADDIINDNNGFTVEYGNVEELSEKMKFLYHNIDRYSSEDICDDCKKRFSKQNVVSKIENIYLKL